MAGAVALQFRSTLQLDDYIAEDNTVLVVDVFVDELNLTELGFDGVAPAITGRPSYFLIRRKGNVATEMSLHVLAYNLAAMLWTALIP